MRRRGAIARLAALTLVAGAGLISSSPSRADISAPSLTLPVACEPGKDCMILRYMDVDPGPGRLDFSCGAMTNDKHKGTDVALTHDGMMALNVPVLASAPGRVVGIRDGVRDVNVREIGPDKVKGRECGNGVRLDHGGGWATQYCHLRRGSVLVKRGDRVERGQALGAIGMSGLTEYAHVHLTVYKNNKPIDPFVGVAGKAKRCGPGKQPLWEADTLARFGYDAGRVYHAGIAGRVPKAAEARAGKLEDEPLTRDSPAIVFWFQIAGTRPGDELSYRLVGPDGEVLAEKTEKIEKLRLRAWRLIGRKQRGRWAPGRYRGVVEWRRGLGPGAGNRREERARDIE